MEQLSEFIVRSRQWIHATRGRELLHHASLALRDIFRADSGCFVYQKRLSISQVEGNDVPCMVYAAWGVFEEIQPKLQNFMTEYHIQAQDLFSEVNDGWSDTASLPSSFSTELRDLFVSYRPAQIGVWKLQMQERVRGALILARGEPSEDDDASAIGTCTQQVALMLDMLLHWRTMEIKEQQYRSLIDYNPDLIYETDLGGNLLAANAATERITGFTYQELQDTAKRKAIVIPEHRSRVERSEQKVMQGMPQSYDVTIRRRDGSRRHLSVKRVPIIVHGNNVGAFGIGKDMTELKETEAKYRSLVEKALVGVYIIQNSRYSYVNPKFCEIFGYAPHEILGRPAWELAAPEDQEFCQEKIRARIQGEMHSIRFQVHGRTKSGKTIEVEVLGSRSTYRGKPAVIGTLLDITEQKLSQQLLQKSEKLAVVGQLAAGVAHEIRNPLTALKGFVQLISEQPNNAAYCSIMLSELQRIESIITEFLMIAKPQAVAFRSNNVQSLLQDVIALVNTQGIMNNVGIQTHVDVNLPPIECDANQLKQVFLNVLKNAVEAMPSGGEITVEAKRKDEHTVFIRFIDSGCGIPEMRIPRLGEPFYTTKERGTGLGLMITFKIIETHRGEIQILSEEGVGTTVEISLPIHRRD